MKLKLILAAVPALLAMVFFSCSEQTRLVRTSRPQASISVTDAPAKGSPDEGPGLSGGESTTDSIVVRNVDGHDFIVMKAIRDDDGNMVANRVLEAATITARFRNVAERHGKVDIEFLITVPEMLINGKWQLRYLPTMFILEDSVRLDKVLITGKEYRRRQLRGYQHYRRFVDSIISDTSLFIRREALEIFLRRNIPQLYAFKTDSSFVSEEEFNSAFGVNRAEATDHYTRKLAMSWNERKKSRMDIMKNKYIKVPIISDGIRLDSVVVSPEGGWTYHYVQTIATRPSLRKVDIVLDGSIYEQDRKICDMTRSEPLRFYISSVSTLVDDSPRYITRVIERRAEATMAYSISFRSGKWNFDENLGDNRKIMREIKGNCASLLSSEVFQLDSICISAGASPEGSEEVNMNLSSRRSGEISRLIRSYVQKRCDSLSAEEGFFIDETGGKDAGMKKKTALEGGSAVPEILSSFGGEDWESLDRLIGEDLSLDDAAKKEYFSLSMTAPADLREKMMSWKKWYPYVRGSLYPRLRQVKFDFHLHRRAMVKDTIHTTELDTVYMDGIQAIKDRDYAKAIEILRPYNDYNTAVAYCAKDYNHSAMAILSSLDKTPTVNYMLALLYSRMGDEGTAVGLYLECCRQDGKFVHRGNLDPEISYLIKKYGLNRQADDQSFQ